MEQPYNQTFKRQAAKLIPATFKKGIISAIYTNSSTADVMFVGNQQTIIKSVPFASSINVALVSVGDKCKIDCFDETNPNDMVIAYTYGKTLPKTFAVGSFLVTTAGVAIPHKLYTTPNLVGFIKTDVPTGNIDVYQYAVPDSLKIYLKSINGNMNVNWFVGKV